MDVARFKKKPVMGILRGIAQDELTPLIETVIGSGLETIEITMNTQGACELIRRAAAQAKGRLMIGAGTVLDTDSLKAALDAGATFIVMPTVVDEVLAYCLTHKIPSFPGGLTPQEIYNGWRKGAAMVKVFPAKCFGPEYFKEIKGPFNDIALLACGGVTPQNLKAYFANGASAVSFGASVFRKELLAKKDFTAIGRHIKEHLQELPAEPASQ